MNNILWDCCGIQIFKFDPLTAIFESGMAQNDQIGLLVVHFGLQKHPEANIGQYKCSLVTNNMF